MQTDGARNDPLDPEGGMMDTGSLPTAYPSNPRAGPGGRGVAEADGVDLIMIRTIEEQGTARVRARMPLLCRWRQMYRLPSGELVETDFLWMPLHRWLCDERSSSPAWRTRRIGAFVLAFRVTA